MLKILFICHGNICRSPMSEFIFRDMVTRRGLSDCFHIASAATSREEIGNPVYPPARRILKAHGIDCSGKTARQMTRADYQEYDYLLAAENYNIRNMMRILGSDPDKKVHRLLDFSDSPRANAVREQYRALRLTPYCFASTQTAFRSALSIRSISMNLSNESMKMILSRNATT